MPRLRQYPNLHQPRVPRITANPGATELQATFKSCPFKSCDRVLSIEVAAPRWGGAPRKISSIPG
jgi:hypothetical protein